MGATTATRSDGVRAPRRRRRWVRWGLLALAGVALLLVCAALVVQIVLGTDYPRARVVRALEDATGLAVDAGSLDVGWRGRSELRDVTFRMPLSDDPLVKAPRVRVRHSSIPSILSGAPVEVLDLEVERPEVSVVETRPGEWNLLEARDQIVSLQAGEAEREGALALPAVDIRDGTVSITRADGRRETFPLSFRGQPRGRLAWEFAGTLGDAAEVEGKLSPQAQWAHEVDFRITDPRRLLGLFIEDPPRGLRAAGTWRGRRVGEGVEGWLALDRLSAEGATVRGAAGVSVADGVATVLPDGLTIEHASAPPVRLTGGTITIKGNEIAWRGLAAQAPGLAAELTGSWERGDNAVRTAAVWRGEGGGFAHEGSGELRAAFPRIGPFSFSADLRSTGRGAGMEWSARADLSAEGPDWQRATARLTLPRATLGTDEREVDLSGLGATVRADWPVVTLGSLTLPHAASTNASGEYDAQSGEWRLSLGIRRLDPPPSPGIEPLDIDLDARGDRASLEFSRLHLAAPSARVRLAGSYRPGEPGRPAPLLASGDVWYRMPREKDPASIDTPDDEAGVWTGTVEAAGTVMPLEIGIDGRLVGREIPVARGVVEDVEVPIRARVTDGGATLSAEGVELLGGVWSLDGRYEREASLAEAQLEIRGARVGALGELALPGFELTGALDASLALRIPELDPGRARLEGGWEIDALRTPAGPASRASGRIAATPGRISITEIAAAQDGGTLSGSVECDLTGDPDIRLDIAAVRWPVALAATPVGFLVDGKARVALDPVHGRAEGEVLVDAQAVREVEHPSEPGQAPADPSIGRLQIDARLAGRTIEARRIWSQVAGGVLLGSATVPLDDWVKSTGKVEFADIQLAQFAPWHPQALGLGGILSGTIQAGPSALPDTYGPLRIDLLVEGEHAVYRELEFRELTSAVYLRPGRVLVDVSTLRAGGGEVSFWSRLTWHGKDPFLHVSAHARGVSLDQVVRTINPEIGVTPGLIEARANAGGYLTHPRRAYGAALATVTESDLGRLPVISQLYGLLNLNAQAVRPTGRSEALFRLDGDALELTRLHHFNRGADVVAAGTAENVWLGRDSAVRGVAAATLRPLRDLNVPLLDLDRLLRGLQAGAASLRVSGTLGEPETRAVPFSEIGQTVGRVLGAPAE